MKRLVLLPIVLLITAIPGPGQTDNTFHVKAFAGSDVGAKTAAAQKACAANVAIPCIIVFDPSLAVYGQGVTPAKCPQCIWQDWRSGGASLDMATKQYVDNLSLSVKSFGARCDGFADDSVALNAIGTSSPSAGYTVTFPPNAVCITSQPITTWAKPNLHIIGNGARIKFTGPGRAIDLHAAKADPNGIANFQMEGLVLQGNPLATYGIYSDTVLARGRISVINIQDFSQACVYAWWELMEKVDLVCSANKAAAMGTPQVTTPINGVILGDTDKPFANNRYMNITAEGVKGIAVWCKYCTDSILAGTGEESGTGLQIEALSARNIFLGFDTEINSVQDVLERGHADTFIDHISLGIFNLENSFKAELNRGLFHSIKDNGGSFFLTIHDSQYSYGDSLGTIDLNGNTHFPQVWNVIGSGNAPYADLIAPVRFSFIQQSTHSANTSARNWCWTPDVSAVGWFELWMSTTNLSSRCTEGSPVMQIHGADVVFPGGKIAAAAVNGGVVNAFGGFSSRGVLGFTGTKKAGTCVLTISGGIITAVSGC